MNLFEVESLTKSSANLKWAKEHYQALDNIVFYSVEDIRNGNDIYATFSSYGKLSTCGIRIVDENVHSTTCGCRYHTKDDVCGHVIVALYIYLDYGPLDSSFDFDTFLKQKDLYSAESETKIIFSKTDHYYDQMKRNSLKFVESFREDNQVGILKTISKSDYKLTFEVKLVEDYEYSYYSGYVERSFIEVGLKIGDERLYVVKSITELMDNIDQNKSYKYGKYLTLAHSEDVFDVQTQAILNPLRRLISKRAAHRYMIFHEEHYDELFDFLKMVDPDRMNIFVDELPIESHLIIEKIDEDTFMLNNADGLDYIVSKEYFYELEKDVFLRYVIDNPQVQKLVMNIHKEGYMVVNKETMHMIDVYLKDDKSVIRNYDLKQNEVEAVKLYLDVDGEKLVSNLVLQVEGVGNVKGFDKRNRAYFNKDAMMVYDAMHAIGEKEKFDTVTMSLYEDQTFEFLEKGLMYLHQFCDVYASESLKNIHRPTKLSINVGISINNNLLDVDISSLQVSSKDLAELLNMYRRKKSYHRLSSGEVINLESQDLKELDELITSLQLKPKDIEEVQTLPLFRSFQIEGNTENYESITAHLDKTVENFNAQFETEKINEIQINPRYEAILKDYQAYGVRWLSLLSKYGFSGILADDMGLGKTLQIIALLESKKQENPSIVVCPASLLFNWEDELKKFNSGLKHICIYGPKNQRLKDIKTIEDYDLVITTYDYLKSDIEAYDAHTFDTVVIDEAQYIKNHNTVAAKSVKKLKSQYRVALSGTPIENRLSELWSIFDFLMPGYLYTYTAFRTNYEKPVVIDQDEQVQKALRNLIEPFILRRTKQEVLKDLPEKTEKIISFNFDEKERDLYLAKLSEGNKAVGEILGMANPNKLSILKILGELRQMCCDPRLLYSNYEGISSKMKGCLEIVDSIVENNEKVLIFSSFTSILDLLEDELQKRNIKYHMLTGSTNKEDRKSRVASFQEDDSQVFLMSLKAAGVGLNLTSAQNVIHFDPWWNVSAENQATDRTHRIGQKNDVQVYKLIMKDSIEEKILKMQEHKKNLSDMFIEGSTGSFSSLSKDEILDLFK